MVYVNEKNNNNDCIKYIVENVLKGLVMFLETLSETNTFRIFKYRTCQWKSSFDNNDIWYIVEKVLKNDIQR